MLQYQLSQALPNVPLVLVGLGMALLLNQQHACDQHHEHEHEHELHPTVEPFMPVDPHCGAIVQPSGAYLESLCAPAHASLRCINTTGSCGSIRTGRERQQSAKSGRWRVKAFDPKLPFAKGSSRQEAATHWCLSRRGRFTSPFRTYRDGPPPRGASN